jgi:hypothetical protein
VYDAFLVTGVNTAEQLYEVVDQAYPVLHEGFYVAAEAFAIDEFHDQKRNAAFFDVRGVNGDYGRMVDCSQNPAFIEKAFYNFIFFGHFGKQKFDRNLAPEVDVEGTVNLPHSAGAEARQYFVMSADYLFCFEHAR